MTVYIIIYYTLLQTVSSSSAAQCYTYIMPIILSAGQCNHQFRDLHPFEGNALQVA